MSLGTQFTALWRRARPFRVALIAAVVVTVFAAVSGRMGGGGSQNNSGNQVAQQNPQSGGGSSTAPAPAPQVAQPTHCGPSGGTTLQAPVVVGNQVPKNVTAVGGQQQGGLPLDVIGRFTQFATQVDAAASEPRDGESCALMADAIPVLEATDYAYADCFKDGQQKLTRAQRCSQSHAQSEARFKRLIEAFEAAEENRSAPQVAALAQARTDMLPYDERRERWREVSQMLIAADTAADAIAQSDKRIQQLVGAANAARANRGVATLTTLAAASSLDAIDLPRLTTAQKEMLEEARTARADIDASNRRLDVLAEAVQGLATGGEQARAVLIEAVSALTPFDTQRADATQAAQIASARAEAAGFAMSDLLAQTQIFEPTTAPAQQFRRIVDLADIVTQHGGIETPTPEQTQAFEIAAGAASALSRSDRRISAMSETMAAVKSGGPAAMGQQVLTSYDAITDFDISRMEDAQRRDLEGLKAAREVTVATSDGTVTFSVPIFVASSSQTQQTDVALESLKSRLISEGFNLVDAEQDSAIRLTLNVGDMETGGVRAGNVTVKTARIGMTLTGEWTFAGDKLPVQNVEGIGRGRSSQDKAINSAVDALVEAITDLAKET